MDNVAGVMFEKKNFCVIDIVNYLICFRVENEDILTSLF